MLGLRSLGLGVREYVRGDWARGDIYILDIVAPTLTLVPTGSDADW